MISSLYRPQAVSAFCAGRARPRAGPSHAVVRYQGFGAGKAVQRIHLRNLRIHSGSGGGGSGGNGGNGGEGSSYDDDGEDEDNKNSGKSLLLSIYGVLIGVGGTIGYMKKKSKQSLMAGLGVAAICLICAELVQGPYGLIASCVALGVSTGLGVKMGQRAWDSRKMMPSGLVSGLSLGVSIYLASTL